MSIGPDEILAKALAAERRGDRVATATLVRQRAARLRSMGRAAQAERLEAAVAIAPPAALKLPRGMEGFVRVESPERGVVDVALSPRRRVDVGRLLSEHAAADKLAAHGLAPTHRVLLSGPPGCGKTVLACALAHELGRPLLRVMPTVVGSYLGETVARLRKVADFVAGSPPCVLLIDEVDAYAQARGAVHDPGEMRRVLLALLQIIEELPASCLAIAATNRPGDFDEAMPRRFDAHWTWGDVTVTERAELRAILTRRHPGLTVGAIGGVSLAEAERSVLRRMRTEVACAT